MSMSGFVFRDVMQYILPTIIGLCLFAPLFGYESLSIDSVVLCGIVFGYAATSPLGRIVSKTYEWLPFLRKKIQAHQERAEWMDQNWEYGKLFYKLSKDERDYLYLTAAYMQFYQFVAFYFFVYALTNLAQIGIAISEVTPSVSSLLDIVQNESTLMFGGWVAPTVVVIIITFAIAYHAVRDYLLEYRLLFYPKGNYDYFSRQHHSAQFSIAKSVWGQVLKAGNGQPKVEVNLRKPDGMLSTTETDEDGYFQFVGQYESCVNSVCAIDVGVMKIKKSSTSNFPYIEIEVE